ncbi:hypothetical protein SteCoe_25407 [Stentor coeruleus]|uniref:EF-hand domain-containing protein n=1 Tax=Stentor coeruleus TaxID=5963 RepID=A0A1R2BFE0_9CILI|nr:hypothetical protein SteCoe_25407 [Stentor coeruleus]
MALKIAQQVLAELNQCRDNPKKYSEKITSTLKYYKGKIFQKPGKARMETKEGTENVEACASYLKSLRPLQPLKWSDHLYLAAQEHVDDIGPKGIIGHNSSNGKEPVDRITNHCKWSGALGENISYGQADPEDIVLSMLIDDGVLARGQRLNIMKRDHNYVGIAIGKHTEYEVICVIIFAEEIKNDDEPIIEEHKNVEIERILRKYTLRKMRTIEAFETFDIRNYEKPGLGEKKIREIKGLFDFFDNEEMGMIDIDDIKSIADCDDLEISNITAFQKALELESAGKKYDFNEFLELMTEKSSLSMSYSQTEIMDNSVISTFNKNQDKSIINKNPNIIENKDISSLADEDVINIKEYFDAIDVNGTGILSSDTFKTFIQSKTFDKSSSGIIEAIMDINPNDIEGSDFSNFLVVLARKVGSLKSLTLGKGGFSSNITGSDMSMSISSVSSSKKVIRKPKQDAYESRKPIIPQNALSPKNPSTLSSKNPSTLSSKNPSTLSPRNNLIQTSSPKSQNYSPKNQTKQVTSPKSQQNIAKGSAFQHNSKKKFSNFNPQDYVTDELTKEHILELKDAFDMFDIDNTGFILAKSLKDSMEHQGFKKRNPIIYNLVHSLHVDKKTKVDFAGFVDLLSGNNEETSTVDEIRMIFNIFDVDKKGFIELKNLKRIARELGESLNEKDLMELIRKSDLDGDGKVSFDDFYSIMTR